MGRVRYIGSKARVVDDIMAIVGPPSPSDGYFVDAFCGTGIVGATAADLGWSVSFNDNLESAVITSAARLYGADTIAFEELDGYSKTLDRLNALKPEPGFIWREYSPASETQSAVKVKRLYFTEANAGRIDAIRRQIEVWRSDGTISESEYTLLLADLLSASNVVANIAGTYGCFLSSFSDTSERDIALIPRKLRQHTVPSKTQTCDVFEIEVAPNDVVYFDPPYTKRQYAAYYHILETIAQGDEPVVEGKTGLRPWKDKASPFCYKTKALRALHDLIDQTRASRIFLSYSSEGHVARDDLDEVLAPLGDITFHELGEIGRYRPNAAASEAASTVSEYLVEVVKAASLEEAA